MCSYFHLDALIGRRSIDINTKLLLLFCFCFFVFASNVSSSRCSHAVSLSNNEGQNSVGLLRVLFLNTFATHSDLRGVIDAACWEQIGRLPRRYFLSILESLPLTSGKSSMPDTVDSVVTCDVFLL